MATYPVIGRAQSATHFVLRASGDGSKLSPQSKRGMSDGDQLYTPDGIIWDVQSVVPDLKDSLVIVEHRRDTLSPAVDRDAWTTLSDGYVPGGSSLAQDAATVANNAGQAVADAAKSASAGIGTILLIAAIAYAVTR